VGIYQQAKGDLLRIAAQLVGNTTPPPGPRCASPAPRCWKIPCMAGHGQTIAAGVRFDAELRWHRLRGRRAAPAWCDGALYERGAGRGMSFSGSTPRRAGSGIA
jgi:hypothetical protein